MQRQGILVGFLAGGWLATIVILLVPHLGLAPAAAEDPPGTIPLPFGPGGPPGVGPTINPSAGERAAGLVNPGNGTSDSNHRSIALSASVGSGQSVVYYFDTVAQRLCVYQYQPGGRGGLRLLAARMIDYDLKLESYRDLSEKTPREMREAYERAMGDSEGARGAGSALPTRHVSAPGGMR